MRPIQTRSGFNPIQDPHQHPGELKAQVKRPSRAVTTLTTLIPKAHLMTPSQQMDLQAVGTLSGVAPTFPNPSTPV